MALRKLIGKIHLWLGLASGLVVFILGVTGCILVFEEEIKSIVYSDIFQVEVAENDYKPVSQLLEAAQNGLTSDLPVTDIQLFPEQNHSVKFYAFKTKADDGIWYWDGREFFNLFVNPYTSKVLKEKNADFEFFFLIEQLHYSLLLKAEIGKPIIGTSTIIFIIMLITGLVLWWPKNKAAKRQRVWFRWKPTTKWKRKNYDLHSIIGFYSMFLVIFIALTGLMWAFTWFSDGVEWIANGGKTIEKERPKIESTIAPFNTTHPLDIVHHSLKANHAEAEVYYINLPQDSIGTVGAYVMYEDLTKNVNLQYDQYSGALLYTGDKWEDKTNGEKVRAYNYDIHVGAIGGLPNKILNFFLSLFAASLPVTGFLIWRGRRKKQHKLPGAVRADVAERGMSTKVSNYSA
ncbi:MAG: PepSY-associated TM helix domain-containing protein [Bacteroidota bacterium]